MLNSRPTPPANCSRRSIHRRRRRQKQFAIIHRFHLDLGNHLILLEVCLPKEYHQHHQQLEYQEHHQIQMCLNQLFLSHNRQLHQQQFRILHRHHLHRHQKMQL